MKCITPGCHVHISTEVTRCVSCTLALARDNNSAVTYTANMGVPTVESKDNPDDPLKKQIYGKHYKELVIQPIEYIHANNIPFAEGSIIKYVTRWRAKNGIKDLEKAKHFIELLIELETKEK